MQNAEILFERFKTEDYNLIREMVSLRQEEHLFLDFKEKRDAERIGLSDDDKRNYGKALSGYSNSSGGIVVWGVSTRRLNEEPDAADQEAPISNIRRFLTDLNGLINDSLMPVNPGVQNLIIEKPGEEEKGFIITYVPESDLPPHRAMLKLNNYYIRAGDSFLLMEHYMLADSFGRRQKPNLELYINFQSSASTGDSQIYLELVIGIKNTGKYVAKFPSLLIQMDTRFVLSIYGVDGNHNWNLKTLRQTSHTTREGLFFVGGNDDVVHPNSTIEVAVYHFNLRPIGIKELIDGQHSRQDIVFKYEIYAENFVSVQKTARISFAEMVESLRRSGIINDNNDG